MGIYLSGPSKRWKARGWKKHEKPGVEGSERRINSSLIASCRLLADLMHVAEGNADEA
jgi:hypothetical protein